MVKLSAKSSKHIAILPNFHPQPTVPRLLGLFDIDVNNKHFIPYSKYNDELIPNNWIFLSTLCWNTRYILCNRVHYPSHFHLIIIPTHIQYVNTNKEYKHCNASLIPSYVLLSH